MFMEGTAMPFVSSNGAPHDLTQAYYNSIVVVDEGVSQGDLQKLRAYARKCVLFFSVFLRLQYPYIKYCNQAFA